MLSHRPTHHGLPVDTYHAHGDILRARVVYPDGTKNWMFVGYVEDIARNIQLGLYEGE
jgi:hypothetical protein